MVSAVVHTDATEQQQQQGDLRPKALMIFQQIRGRKSYIQLSRAIRTGLQTGHTQHAVPVVLQLGRVGVERASPCSLSLRRQGIGEQDRRGGTALVTSEGAALATAHLLSGSQLHHRKLGKHAVHAADGAQVAAPEATFIDQAEDDRPPRP